MWKRGRSELAGWKGSFRIRVGISFDLISVMLRIEPRALSVLSQGYTPVHKLGNLIK